MIDAGEDPWGANQGGPPGVPKGPKMASELHPKGSILVDFYHFRTYGTLWWTLQVGGRKLVILRVPEI